MDNLDALTKSANEHTQNGDYFNQVSEIIKNLIGIYTVNASVVVIGTVTNISNLNQRLYTSRGNQTFGKIHKISELSKVTCNFVRFSKKICLLNYLIVNFRKIERILSLISAKKST